MTFSRWWGIALVAWLCAGCGGSAMGSHAAPLVLVPQPTVSQQARGVFTVRIPLHSTELRPAYISPSTQSISFQVASQQAQVVSLGSGSPACTPSGAYDVCTAYFGAPVGTNTMLVETFASSNGTGSVLSMNSVQIDIVAGQVNPVNVVLNGVAASLTLSLAPATVTQGTVASIDVTWNALDASGNVIVGPGSPVDGNGNPLSPSLTASDPLDFTITAAASPAPTGWMITYDGTASKSPTITLRAGSLATVSSALTVEPEATTDWGSFGYDLERTGDNPNEHVVSANNVATLQSVWTYNVGYTMVREPVLASNVTINGTPTNVLYAGSNFGSTLYALNAQTGAVIWSFPVPSASYTCGTGTSQFAISGAPAVDRTNNRIYFADGHNQLHGVDLATGKEDSGWPITIADYTPDHNFMHGGLTYNPANGMLYAPTGSTCDIHPWYGRIDAINAKTATIVGTFYPTSGSSTQRGSGGGIWGYGGASIDPATNDVFIASGNADELDPLNNDEQNYGDSESVVELGPDVNTVVAANYPANIPAIPGDDDLDFGTTPVLFTPAGCPPMLAAINKSGMFELYDRSTLAQGPVQWVQMSISTANAAFFGAPAYDAATGYIYVALPATQGIYLPGLAAFAIASNCEINPVPVWNAEFGPDGASTTAATVRSAVTVANGVVYVSNASGNTEFAFNASTGAELWSAGLSADGSPGTIVANGMVYVSAADGTITAWALPSEAAAIRRLRSPSPAGSHTTSR